MFDDDAPAGKKRGRRKPLLLILAAALILAIAALVAVGALLWHEHQHKSSDVNSAAVQQRIITEISKLYLVPTDEKPTVAQIRDHTKLSGQIFFERAQDGDYLVIYEKAQTALLYREPINKLVRVGSITIHSGQGSSATNGGRATLPNVPNITP